MNSHHTQHNRFLGHFQGTPLTSCGYWLTPAAMATRRTSSSGRVIIKMSVRIPDGREGTIHVFPDDDPRELAVKVRASRSRAPPPSRAERGHASGAMPPNRRRAAAVRATTLCESVGSARAVRSAPR